jgi:hypothetical protein
LASLRFRVFSCSRIQHIASTSLNNFHPAAGCRSIGSPAAQIFPQTAALLIKIYELLLLPLRAFPKILYNRNQIGEHKGGSREHHTRVQHGL